MLAEIVEFFERNEFIVITCNANKRIINGVDFQNQILTNIKVIDIYGFDTPSICMNFESTINDKKYYHRKVFPTIRYKNEGLSLFELNYVWFKDLQKNEAYGSYYIKKNNI